MHDPLSDTVLLIYLSIEIFIQCVFWGWAQVEVSALPDKAAVNVLFYAYEFQKFKHCYSDAVSVLYVK